MRTIFILLQKEFRQIFRNRSLVGIMLVAPLGQLLILPLAADYEVKNIRITIVDEDRSSYSRQLANKVGASGYFQLVSQENSFPLAYPQIEKDEADIILHIPAGFERNLIREDEQKLFVAVNAINGVKAGLGSSYLVRIIRNFNHDVRMEWIQEPRFNPFPVVSVTSSNWFNQHLNYDIFMVPGILAVLVTMLGGYLTALNIVREKEVGTIEQVNVTPIRKHHFILGKLIPFWVVGMVVFSAGLGIIAFGVYGIVPQGSLLVLYLFLAIYLLAVLGFGLLISTYSATQQQAMSIAFFFMMIFMLMSGLFTPIDSMPGWAKVISHLSPVTYFIEVMRMVVLKGSSFQDIKYHLAVILAFAVVLNSWAILNYRKTN